jgi:hypothetical protein
MRSSTAQSVPTFASRRTIGSQTLLRSHSLCHKAGIDTPVLRNYWTHRLRATLLTPIPMRASLLGMYLVQAVAFGAKRLAQRRGVALRSTAAYDALTKELREVARLEEVSGILSYDEQCFMSEGSAASRAAQKEALAGVIHEKRTSTRMAEVIDAARGLKLDDARESANVRDAIEGFDVESRKSKDLAEREARLESECFVRLGVPETPSTRRDGIARAGRLEEGSGGLGFPGLRAHPAGHVCVEKGSGRDDAARRLQCW